MRHITPLIPELLIGQAVVVVAVENHHAVERNVRKLKES